MSTAETMPVSPLLFNHLTEAPPARAALSPADDAPTEVSAPELIWALGGLTGLSVVGGLAAPDALSWAQLLPVVPAICLGTAALSAPPLLVVGPWFDLNLRAHSIAAALAVGASRAGRLAWGLLPALAFGVLTSRGGLTLWLIAVAVVGLAGVRTASRRLAAEAGEQRAHTVNALTLVWSALATVIGLRLIAELAFTHLPA